MIYPKIPLAQTVIQLCRAKAIKHIIISPGSRSAPLTIGFTNDPYFTCYSIVDERCAGFFAMGIAQQLQEPTALVCTSGSALLNYYPAVAEAFYSEIPLLVLSADRPKYLVGIGDGQTINQKDVYGHHVRYAAYLKLDINKDKPVPAYETIPMLRGMDDKSAYFNTLQEDIQRYNEVEINAAINTAITTPGPVHINIPFDEPLYNTEAEPSVTPNVTTPETTPSVINTTDIEDFVNQWNTASKKLILVGVNTPRQIAQDHLDVLAKDNSVIVLTETTSNLHDEAFFPSIDQLITPFSAEEEKAFQPEILLTFGGLIVSKKIKALLRKYKPNAHWHVGATQANDTFFALTNHIKMPPSQFFKAFIPQIVLKESGYKAQFKTLQYERLQKHASYTETIQFSDFVAFDTILKAIPQHSILQVGNSSAIRYTQLFGVNPTIDVYCNRGTSGIDGSTSTAIGCATANTTKPTTFITGDLSFFYDSNALWNNYIPTNFRIIVINNTGGGIFRILPGHKDTENFDTYFETNHNLTAKQLCEMFGFDYVTAQSKATLETALEPFFNTSNRPRLLEVFTPKTQNDAVLLEYFKYLS